VAGTFAAEVGGVLNNAMSDAERQDDKLYAEAAAELEGGNRNDGLWAKCFAECDGDENKAKALYLKTRVERLKEEAEDEVLFDDGEVIITKTKPSKKRKAGFDWALLIVLTGTVVALDIIRPDIAGSNAVSFIMWAPFVYLLLRKWPSDFRAVALSALYLISGSLYNYLSSPINSWVSKELQQSGSGDFSLLVLLAGLAIFLPIPAAIFMLVKGAHREVNVGYSWESDDWNLAGEIEKEHKPGKQLKEVNIDELCSLDTVISTRRESINCLKPLVEAGFNYTAVDRAVFTKSLFKEKRQEGWEIYLDREYVTWVSDRKLAAFVRERLKYHKLI